MKRTLLFSFIATFLAIFGFGGITMASITFQYYASNEAETPCYTTTTPQYNQSANEDAYYTLYNYDDELLNNCTSIDGKAFMGYKMSREGNDANSYRHIDDTIDTNAETQPQVDENEIYTPIKYVFSTNDVILKAYAQWGTGISEINLTGPSSVTDGDDRLYEWTISTTDNTYTKSNYLPVEWNGTAWVDGTHESVPAGYTVGFKVTLTPKEGYTFSQNPTIKYNGTVWTNSGHTTFDLETNTLYIDLGIVAAAPIEIDHILLVGNFLPAIDGNTPLTDLTINTTGVTIGEVTWGKGNNCTPLEANEKFSGAEENYCLSVSFTIQSGYVLKQNYSVYRNDGVSQWNTDRLYCSDYNAECTATGFRHINIIPVHEVKFSSDGEIVDTRYRRHGCSFGNSCDGVSYSNSLFHKDGYILEGYYTDSGFNNKWNWYSSGVVSNMTLYIHWIEKIDAITISGITVPTSGAQATDEGIKKSQTDKINWGTFVWKVPTTDEPEDPQPVDFNGIFQGGKSYRLYVSFTVAEGYGIQRGGYYGTTLTVNGTQKDINNIGCNNSGCYLRLSYYIPYTITFYDGETVYTTGTAYAGDTINYTWSITNPYVPGKKFLGWFKDPELTQQRRLDTDTVTGDMNLYGKFANQLMNINLTGVVTPAGNVAATVAGISLAEGSSGVQLGTLKWKDGESDFNGKYVSGTQYTLYVPFKLIDDYVMPDYYSYVSFSVNGKYLYKEIGATGDEDYPYYIRTYYTATAPASGNSSPRPSAGGSSSSSSNTNKTGTVETGTNNTGAVETGTNNDEETVNPTNPQAVQENGYTKEFNDAYEFAFENGITTMKTIEEAAMDKGLTRIAMAKMLSQYAINVLGKTPANVEVPNFTDVSAELDAEYDNGVTLAYKLGIMGINMPDNKFLPYETVTRAQFGTALSRLLFGIEDGEDAYYTTHLAKLKEAGIISNDDPTLEELRGYVMLMLMRSAK